MLLDHVVNEAKCTIACLPVPVHEATAFGVMAVNEENMVIDFVEKPAKPPTMPGDDTQALASMGISVLTRTILCVAGGEDLQTPGCNHDFGKVFCRKLWQVAKAMHTLSRSPAFRTTTTRHLTGAMSERCSAYWRANLDLASVMPELDMYDVTWPIVPIWSRCRDKFVPGSFRQSRDDHELLVSGGSSSPVRWWSTRC